MYCRNCGQQIDDRAVVCPHCGAAQYDGYIQPPPPPQPRPYCPAPDDAPNGGFFALCFFIPVVGLILYLVWQQQYPLRAKSCGKGALTGVLCYVGFVVLMVLIAVVAAVSCDPYYYGAVSLFSQLPF